MSTGRTRSHVATWTVLVAIDEPAAETGLQRKLQQFEAVLKLHHQQNALSNVTRQIWVERIRQIESTMISPKGGRTRRGLFNIIGEISRKLFGTATEEEVDETRRRIDAVSNINRRVIHVVNNLVTIVNQTHNQVKQHRRHIREIELYLSLVEREIHILNVKRRTSFKEITVLKSAVEVERILSAVEAAHNNWLRQVDKHRRQRASLELGWLTEEILPRQELRQIIAYNRERNRYAPPIEWYYSHIRVQPIWEEDRRLVFKAELPFTNEMRYLRYFILTWPIPAISRKYNIQLQVPKDVAIDTKTGGLFQPTACLGNRPSICRTGPVYDRARLQCPRGIIAGDQKLRNQCRVTISKLSEATATAQELTPGTIVFYTNGETYSLYCAGRTERRITLSAGLYVTRLNATCQIQGDGWSATGLIRHSSGIYMGLPIIKIPPMNLSRTLSRHAKSLARHFNSPHWDALGNITDIKISAYNATGNDETSVLWGSYPGHISWTALIVTAMTLIALIGLITVIRQRQTGRNKMRHAADDDQPTAGENIKMTTINRDQHQKEGEQSSSDERLHATPPAWRVLTRAAQQ